MLIVRLPFMRCDVLYDPESDNVQKKTVPGLAMAGVHVARGDPTPWTLAVTTAFARGYLPVLER